MDARQRATEFCEGAFAPFGVNLEPYIQIMTELIEGAERDALERAASFDWRGVPTSNIPFVIRNMMGYHASLASVHRTGEGNAVD